MLSFKSLLSVLPAILVSGTSLAAADLSGSVTARGLAVPGATITAVSGDRREVTSTSESGHYRFSNLAPGQWTLAVEMFGFTRLSREVAVSEAAARLDLTLEVVASPTETPAIAAARGAFQQVQVDQTARNEVLSELQRLGVTASQTPEQMLRDANESFLVSGSLSRGLQLPNLEDFLMAARGMAFGPTGEGGPLGPGAQTPPGFGQEAGGGAPESAGPPGGMPQRGMGGPGSPGGPGGMAGPGGMRGSGGFGGPGMGGPGGPFGGRPEGKGEPGQRPEGKGEGGRGPGGREGAMREWMHERGVALFGNRSMPRRDAIRGMLFTTLRNSAFDARPYSLSGNTVAKPAYAQTRFGASAGGQLRIPKLITSERTFFFANYSGNLSRNSYDAIATMPSLAERLGDFSASTARGPVSIFDPSGRLPFPGNRIPASRLDRAALGLLDFFPLPNLPGTVQNYQIVTSVPQDAHNLSTRLIHSFPNRNRLSGSYQLQSRNSEMAQLFGFRDETTGRGQSAELAFTRNFTPRTIVNLRGSFSRNRSETIPFFAYGRDVAAELGIQGTSRDPRNYGPPSLTFTNFGSLNAASPARRSDQTAGFSGDILLVRRSHNVSFGAGYRRMQNNSLTDQNGRGTFSFSGLATSALDGRGQPLPNTGFDLADLLLGRPQSSSIRYGSSDIYFRSTAFNAHLQDDWRVRSNFSLNVGVRYEFATPPHEKYGRMANLDVAPNFSAVTVVIPGVFGPYTGLFPNALIESDRNNLAPRVGLAWRPFQKRTLRVQAGYGVYFNGSVYNQAASRMAQQPPFAQTASLTTSTALPLTLQRGFTIAPAAMITNSFAVDRYYRVGYAQSWNLSLRQDLVRSLAIEVGYLGTKGTRLDIQRMPNRAAPGSPLTSEDRRQINNAVGFIFDSSDGHSIYHAGQVRLMRRFQRGFSANLSYSYGKSIDNVSTFGGGATVVAQNDQDLRLERGLSSFDQRHNLSVFFMVNSPVGDGLTPIVARGPVGRFLKDWNLSGGLTASSGTPFTATVLGNRADAGGTGLVGSGRADATGLPVHVAGSFFNPAAFSVPAAALLGNAGRNTIPGPNRFAMNASLGRSFAVGGERRRLEFRLDANNVLNTPSFTRLATTVNASNFGLATGASAMRSLTSQIRFRF